VPLPRVAVSRSWHADSAVRGSGGDGLARRAIIATIAVVVPAAVANAMTTVVVLIVVLVPVTTVAVVATAGRARRHGGRWPGCRERSVGVERRWDS
jgi:hypothetical protein